MKRTISSTPSNNAPSEANSKPMLADPPQPRPRDLIFISYAYEDEVFARWLARKLAFYGYGVWLDQMKILGGESWVEEVEVAITECSIRVLAILSKSSITKANPRKERTKALDLGRSLGISDFLLTLNLDGTKPDWTISDISYISFRESWAHGLRRVLKKLQSINAPQIHAQNIGIAASTLETGGELMLNEPETVSSNWLPFLNLPQALKVFDT
ncbi:MAG: toll/interleukin-1 receptor domain-containing protein, partial [Proteobacteria bacterium]